MIANGGKEAFDSKRLLLQSAPVAADLATAVPARAAILTVSLRRCRSCIVKPATLIPAE